MSQLVVCERGGAGGGGDAAVPASIRAAVGSGWVCASCHDSDAALALAACGWLAYPLPITARGFELRQYKGGQKDTGLLAPWINVCMMTPPVCVPSACGHAEAAHYQQRAGYGRKWSGAKDHRRPRCPPRRGSHSVGRLGRCHGRPTTPSRGRRGSPRPAAASSRTEAAVPPRSKADGKCAPGADS